MLVDVGVEVTDIRRMHDTTICEHDRECYLHDLVNEQVFLIAIWAT